MNVIKNKTIINQAKRMAVCAILTMILVPGCSGDHKGNGDVTPVISSFHSDAEVINPGATVVLESEFSHGYGQITPGDISVLSGQKIVFEPSVTTTYVLKVTSPSGKSVLKNTIVTVAEKNDGSLSIFSGRIRHTGIDDGEVRNARFMFPTGLVVDGSGTIFVADSGNRTIRKITPTGIVSTLAGSPGLKGSEDGSCVNARFGYPSSVAMDHGGNIYVTDTGNGTLRKISAEGVVATLGGRSDYFEKEGFSTFGAPTGLAVDNSGIVYVLDGRGQTIKKVTTEGEVITLVGANTTKGSLDGLLPDASFSEIQGLAIDRLGNIYVTDRHAIRKMTPGGYVSTIAGKCGEIDSGGCIDGLGNDSRFLFPGSLTVDDSGNIYVVDGQNTRIRKISPDGMVRTVMVILDPSIKPVAIASDPVSGNLFYTWEGGVAKITM